MRNTSQIATTLPNDQKQALERWCEKQTKDLGFKVTASAIIRAMVQEGMVKRGIIKEKK